MMLPFLRFSLHYNACTRKNQARAGCTAWKFFAALALHLHNIRAVIVYTCIIPRVTISMFKIGFSQKGWTFSPRVVPDFFRHGSFCFGQFLIWEVLQMTVIRPPWRNDYAIKSLIRSRAYWLRISGLWLCSELVLAYIIFGYAIVPFYHFCTPIIFSSMGILVVNDSDKESCRIENWHTQILQYMSTCVEHIPSGFAYGSGNSISFFAWNCQSYSFDKLIMRFSV